MKKDKSGCVLVLLSILAFPVLLLKYLVDHNGK
jgi:hypothetical protein